jgi:hypothetical protein
MLNLPSTILTTIALCSALALSACSNSEMSTAAGSQTAQPAASATPEAAKATATATAEPDYPQPAIIIPPRPKAGAPHGPGFDMPMIELAGYAPSRPMEVLRDAHTFTADHPEVASYVPCYCGCGSAGHKNNADCFVKGRDPQGRVTEWEPHGVACAVCIDIAVESMKMKNSGASVMAIRRKIQNEYRPKFPSSETPTPGPPSGK